MSNTPKLSWVMATADDYFGVVDTITTARIYQDLPADAYEFVVVDNDPDAAGSDLLREKIAAGQLGRTRYVELRAPRGTSPARERAIAEAAAPWVLCSDPHVKLTRTDALSQIVAYAEAHPDSRDILSGPLVGDDLGRYATHFNDHWRGGMWGVWGQAWQKNAVAFSVLERDEQASYCQLAMGCAPAPLKLKLPAGAWAGHVERLLADGCRQLADDPAAEFEIPGMGLGAFFFRRAAWPGFHALSRGFGGEEMYLHEKFRQRGGKALCVGFAAWWHRFGRPATSTPYGSSLSMARNYALELPEIGYALDAFHAEYVGTGRISEHQYRRIVANPEREIAEPVPFEPAQFVASATAPQAVPARGIEHIYREVQSGPGYFSEHMDYLRSLAAQCEHVVDVSRYRETTIALAAAKPPRMHAFIYENSDPIYDELARIAGPAYLEIARHQRFADFEIPDCEFLFFKTPHNHETLAAELDRWSPHVSRWIGLHDTMRNGQRLDNGKEGYQFAIAEFIHAHPEWFPYYHSHAQTGLTILGRRESDRPAQPPMKIFHADGPGTRFKELAASLGLEADEKCSCRSVMHEMNQLRASGCRERREEMVAKIQKNYAKWKWTDKIKLVAAAGKALVNGVAFKVNPLDPIGSLYDLAIDLEEERLAAKDSQ